MAGISFTAADFAAKLREGHFASAPLSVTGLVKLPDDEGVRGRGKETAIKALQFAHGSNCDHWITVPLTLIDRVDFLRVVRCKDHSHPLVTLVFSLPQTSEAQTFAAIANLASAPPATSPLTRAVPVFNAPIAYHPVQTDAFLTRFNMASAVSSDGTVSPTDGRCPDNYYWCGMGLGCCPR